MQASNLKIDVDAYSLGEGYSDRGSPERNLLMAIMERAILDYVGNNQKEADLAEKWIFEKQEKPYDTLSFYWLCTELDLDPERIANSISNMPKRGNSRVAPWYTNEITW